MGNRKITFDYLMYMLYEKDKLVLPFAVKRPTALEFIHEIFPKRMLEYTIKESVVKDEKETIIENKIIFDASRVWSTPSRCTKFIQGKEGPKFSENIVELLNQDNEIIYDIYRNWERVWMEKGGNYSLFREMLLKQNYSENTFVDVDIIGVELSEIILGSDDVIQVLTILSLYAILGSAVNAILFDWHKLQIYHESANAESCGRKRNNKENRENNDEKNVLYESVEGCMLSDDYCIEYYKKVWRKYVYAEIRDEDSHKFREMIDIYVLPKFMSEEGMNIENPFATPKIRKYILAGSGIGKTKLLESIMLSCAVDEVYKYDSSMLSDNSKEKYENGDYRRVKENLFGITSTSYFPVYIPAKSANEREYESVIELAVMGETEFFQEMINAAYKDGKLLILIDSIDELEDSCIKDFYVKVKGLEKQYPNANIIITSRFTGKVRFPIKCDYIRLASFDEEAITKLITYLLSEESAEKMLKKIMSNSYFFELAKNPYMLTVMLTSLSGEYPCDYLESMVNAIIDRRWVKYDVSMSTEGIKLMLGYMACRFIFGGQSGVQKNEIIKLFNEAKQILENILYTDMFVNAEKDIERFINILSCQSGILNVVVQNYTEKYVFQDELVMCYLAAYYFVSMANAKMDADIKKLWSNAAWVLDFIDGFSSGETVLSKDGGRVLAMTMTANILRDTYQWGILYYLIFKGTTSFNEVEKQNIATALMDIVNNSFGMVKIVNRDSGEARRLIEMYLSCRDK